VYEARLSGVVPPREAVETVALTGTKDEQIAALREHPAMLDSHHEDHEDRPSDTPSLVVFTPSSGRMSP
jgi:hypothetical protein